MSTSPLEFDSIVIPKIRGHRILDIGSGYGKWGFLVKKYFWLTADGDMTSQPSVVGIDAFFPHLSRVNSHKIYDALVCANAVRLPFQDGSFDTVVAIEVIEHLPKEMGTLLVQELERVARQCIIISTPRFEDMRGGHGGLDGFNPYEAHKSYWSLEELKRMGFRCYGVGFRYCPFFLKPIFTSITYKVPQLSDHVIGVKLIN